MRRWGDRRLIGTAFERFANTEGIVTVDEPDETGYNNIHVKGN